MITFESKIDSLIRLKEDTRRALTKLNIFTIKDLLYHYPTRYADASSFVSIANLSEVQSATIRGTVKKIISKKFGN